MKKKVLMQVMGVILAAGLMTGCGDAGKENTQADVKTESAADVTEDSTKDEAKAETENESDEAKAETENEGDEAKAETQSESNTADGETDAKAADSANIGKVIPAAGWNITVEDVEINTSLENVSVSLGYTGVETSDYKKEADAGKSFCLIKMKIEKDGSKENFDWANLKLKDSEGNEYTRMEDDFISELGMTRMAGTALNFGSNEGWIAFEIGDGAEGLELNYAFEAEEYHCEL